jgi:hypothetical protein
MVILNYFCGPRNWQIETVRTIDRRMPPRDELESIQRLRGDVSNSARVFSFFAAIVPLCASESSLRNWASHSD